jgi:EAL domain-containing protein (putative c-di-GMP-specific phosphodiesterase class I)
MLRNFRLKNNLYAVMQPIFQIETSETAGFELFSRSTLPDFECPDDFLQAAMENGMLTSVDYECLKVCAAAAAQLPENTRKHINLFPSTLLDMPVHEIIKQFELKQRGEYCLELSDQQMVGDPAALLPAIDGLRKKGFLIGVQDIGFGYSSLESLIILEPDIIKIDKKCLQSAGDTAARIRVLNRLTQMAQALGAELIAAGVESEEDLEILSSAGIQSAQGYLFGAPAVSQR